MKIYISGKITGTDDYMERFEAEEQRLKDEFPDTEIVNPAKIGANMPKTTTWQKYMSICYMLLDMCDAVSMMDGWKLSAGACVEYGYALARDMIIIGDERG